MNMMTMIINRKKILVGLVILAVIISYTFFCSTEKMRFLQDVQMELQTFQLKDGWGYQILIDKKVFIYQPTIPAIDSVKPFPDEVSAGKVGMLVLKRIQSKQSPAVSSNEINQLLSF